MRGACATALLLATWLSGCTIPITEGAFLHPSRRPLDALDPDILRRPAGLTLRDGTRLRGWLVSHPAPVRTVVHLYGNGSTASREEGALFFLARELQARVLCLDYRGYGFSEGRASLRQLAEDSVEVFDLARSHGQPVLVSGVSLGSVLGLHVADARPVAGLMLAVTPPSAEEVVRHLARRLPWYVRWFTSLELAPELAALHPTPLEVMPRVRAPLLLLVAGRDELVPLEASLRLYDLYPGGEARGMLVVLPDARHGDVQLTREEVRRAARDFLHDVLEREPARSADSISAAMGPFSSFLKWKAGPPRQKTLAPAKGIHTRRVCQHQLPRSRPGRMAEGAGGDIEVPTPPAAPSSRPVGPP
jgi:hypothetical protein